MSKKVNEKKAVETIDGCRTPGELAEKYKKDLRAKKAKAPKAPKSKKAAPKKFHGINATLEEICGCVGEPGKLVQDFQCITTIGGLSTMVISSMDHERRVNNYLRNGYNIISSGMTTVQTDAHIAETGFAMFTHLVGWKKVGL